MRLDLSLTERAASFLLSLPRFLISCLFCSPFFLLQTEKKVIKAALGGGLVDVSGRSKDEIQEEIFGDDDSDDDDD